MKVLPRGDQVYFAALVLAHCRLKTATSGHWLRAGKATLRIEEKAALNPSGRRAPETFGDWLDGARDEAE